VRVLTFTSLYPSSAFPVHGVFVPQRMLRLCARNGWKLTVVAPVPRSLPFLPGRRGRYFRVPRVEEQGSVRVHHPRYFHVPRLSVGRQWRNMARACRPLLAEIDRSEGFDLIDSHYLYPDGCAAVFLARELGKPCVVTARGSDVWVLPKIPAAARAMREQLPRADRLMAVAGALADGMAEFLGVPRERIVTVPNGVDMELFHPGDRAAARRDLGLPQETKILLSVGRLAPAKRFDLLIDALAAMPGEPLLVIVGDGPLRSELASRVQRLGLEGRVRLAGEQPPERVAEFMRAADLFSLASDLEGWPNVVMEALASGLHVVARPVGGVPEILTGREGTLVSELAELPALLSRALETPHDPAQSVARAAELGWDGTLRILTEVFEDVVRARKPARAVR
jgi:teichuronic acid biosynthesis glycosyltransferase TuaC